MSKFRPLSPYKWPQDGLRIPNGQGLMPRIDFENGYNTGREGAIYTSPMASFPLVANTAVEFVIPIEADADFWCSEINVHYHLSNDSSSVPSPALKMRIIDVRTAFNLTYPHVRAGMFGDQRGVGSDMPLRGIPCRSTLIQPYCFTRNGGIQLRLEADFLPALAFDAWVSFIGWKEYTYAST